MGVAPNVFGVFALSFTWLAACRPTREGWAAGSTRLFAWGLGVSVVGLLGWEILQIRGNLVFDPADLMATGLGGVTALAVFLVVLRRGRPTR